MGKPFGNAGKMLLRGVSKTAGTRPAPKAGRPRTKPAQPLKVSQKSFVPELAQAEPQSIYSLLKNYRIPSSQMVLEEYDWNTDIYRSGYGNFVQIIRQRMQTDFTWDETGVIVQIYPESMAYMFWEKVLQELMEPGQVHWRTDFENSKKLYHQYSDKFAHAAKVLKERWNKTMPPASFSSSSLWFATFSSDGLPGFFPSGKEHAGSIYFDGGRIRLMHSDGPTLSTRSMNRILYADKNTKNKQFLRRDISESELAVLVENAKNRAVGGERLYEYNTVGVKHTSRGYPKKIALDNSEIAQLYYSIDRICQIRERQIYRESLVNSAGNRLLIQFLRRNAGLRQILGYEGIL